MQFKSLALFILLTNMTLVVPRALKRADAPTDIQILNYALTLEHLENAFYSEALARFDEQAFNNAALNRSLFLEISQHETSHVQFLETALGDQATKACNYSFPYSDIRGFATLSMMLEGVGVSAYLGAAGFITSKQYLTAAGSILTTEARHNAWVSSVANGQTPWSGNLDTPLDFNQVFSLAGAFITSCPSSNPALPFKAFPTLNVTTPTYTPGSNVTLTFDTTDTDASKPLFVAFLNGLTPIFAPFDTASKQTTLPTNLTGTVYAVVTSSQNVTDEVMVAGPAILMFGGSSANSNPNPTSSATSASESGTSGGGSGNTSGKSAAGRLTNPVFWLVTGVTAVILTSLL